MSVPMFFTLVAKSYKKPKNFLLISLEVRLPVLVLQMKFKDFIRLGFLVALAAAYASNDISKFNS